MADIPIHQVVFQFPDEGGGDPARGGTGDGSMNSVLETLKHIQVSVGAINGNVRAILDTLRKISTSGRGIGSGATTGGGTTRAGSGISVERRFHVDPRKSIVPYSPYASSTSGLPPYSPLRFQAEQMREIGRLKRIPLLPMSEVEAAARARRASVVKPIPFGFETDPSAPGGPMPGFVSMHDFGGKSAMKGYARGVDPRTGSIGGGGGSGGGAGAGGGSGGGGARNMFMGIGAVIGTVGKILATVHLVVSSIKAVISLVRYVPQLARDLRAGYGNYSVPMAQMNMSVRMAEIMDQMKIANNRGVVAAYQGFTNSQLMFTAASNPIRTIATKAIAGIGETMMNKFSDASLLAAGLINGDAQMGAVGFWGMTKMTAPWFHWLRKWLMPHGYAKAEREYQAYLNQLLQQSRMMYRQFDYDLEAMTGGRFSLDRAYPNNSLGKPSNKYNWMVGRY